MSISGFDHVAIPIERVDEMLGFYAKLGFRVQDHAPFYSVHFGHNKINLHGPAIWQSETFSLRGPTAKPGCGDFCFVWRGTVTSIVDKLAELSISIIEGPVARAGGAATGTSVYIRDPDENLLEFIVYDE